MYTTRKSHAFAGAFMALSLMASISVPANAQISGGGLKPGAGTVTQESQFSAETTKQDKSVQPAARSRSADPMVSVIVKLKAESLAAYTGDVAGLPATNPTVTGASKLDVKAPASQLYLAYLAQQLDTFESSAKAKIVNAQVTNRYTVILGGVSMLVPRSQIGSVAAMPGVEAVFEDTLLQLDTERSPQFIGAPTVWNALGGQESAGEGVVVGILDTGIWPEHPSFSDPDPSGKAYAAPPASWTGATCQFSGGTNPGPAFTCNNKLIGAQRFMATYEAVVGLDPGGFTTARDNEGHGTHTASTAAGNAAVAASIFGVPRGIISGIAPRAHVAAYKVCGLEGCYSSDSAAAVQRAILDGVNVINFSIGGGSNPYGDAVSLAFLDAYAAGVFVAASAGNSGPGADTTDHREPWVTTVAASTQKRAFNTTVTVADGGASVSYVGASVTGGIAPTPVITAGAPPYNDPQCLNGTADGAFAGKIVVCARGVNGRVEKGYNVMQRGAVGMILYNQAANVTDLETDNHFLPTVHIQYDQGTAILTFLAAHPGAVASWPAGAAGSAKGDVMASFSSRGGPAQSLGISKPDVTAPGVQILAGHTPASIDISTGPQGELFQAIAGTSMSSPHVAGAGALLKALHPNWTPGQIKSALMTSASRGVVKEDGVTPATPFDFGSGRIDLNKAGSVGLTFDETAANYVALASQLWNANYPSLYHPAMPGAITVQRTIHDETGAGGTWLLSAAAPADVTIVVPAQVVVPAGGSATFSITVMAPTVPVNEVRHALIRLRSGSSQLHFPVTFVRKQPDVTLAKTCEPTNLLRGTQTTCTITATNTSFATANVVIWDQLPSPLTLVPASVVGASPSGNGVTFSGPLAGAEPPDVSIAAGASPAGGYLPLADFGITPIGGVGDETIVNFTVPGFQYGSRTYTRIGVTSNGYAVVGGGTAGDVDFINQILPDSAPPNNVLAPFWTDLNPSAGGAIRVGILTDGVNDWLIVEWDAVKEYSSATFNSFQIWIGLNGVEDISYAYGPIEGTGDLGFLTVGAENLFGNRGQNYYVDGTGTLPAEGTQLVVTTTPPAPGETRVITFNAVGSRKGFWQNCASLTSNTFQGANIACVSGQVTTR